MEKQIFKGNILACVENEIKEQGSNNVTKFYALNVDFGYGIVTVTNGKSVECGIREFCIRNRSIYDSKPRIALLDS